MLLLMGFASFQNTMGYQDEVEDKMVRPNGHPKPIPKTKPIISKTAFNNGQVDGHPKQSTTLNKVDKPSSSLRIKFKHATMHSTPGA